MELKLDLKNSKFNFKAAISVVLSAMLALFAWAPFVLANEIDSEAPISVFAGSNDVFQDVTPSITLDDSGFATISGDIIYVTSGTTVGQLMEHLKVTGDVTCDVTMGIVTGDVVTADFVTNGDVVLATGMQVVLKVSDGDVLDVKKIEVIAPEKPDEVVTTDVTPEITKIALRDDCEFAKIIGDYLIILPGKTAGELLEYIGGNVGIVLVTNDVTEDVSPDAVLCTGMKIVLKVSDGSVADTKTISVFGDVNGDGKVRAADARLALRHSVKLEKLTGAELVAADVFEASAESIEAENGIVRAADARAILRVSVELDDMKTYFDSIK